MDIIQKIKQEKIYAIVRSNNYEKTQAIVNALLEGSIKIIEVPVDNDENYKIIENFDGKDNVSIAAGGIITTQQAQRAIDAGAKLIVSPVFQMSMVKFCKNAKISHISTATTANEAYCAWKARVPITKIYPVSNLGSIQYIKDILRPMPFLNVLATGAIQIDEAKEYLKCGATAVAIGRALYDNASYKEITKRSQKLIESIN